MRRAKLTSSCYETRKPKEVKGTSVIQGIGALTKIIYFPYLTDQSLLFAFQITHPLFPIYS